MVGTKICFIGVTYQYIVSKDPENCDILDLTGTHELLVYSGEDTLLGETISGIKKNTEPLLVTGKDTGLVVNAGQLRNINIASKFFDNMTIFKYLGTTVTHRSYSQKLQAQSLQPLSFESFIFPYSSRKYKDKNKMYSNSICCFVWVSDLVSCSKEIPWLVLKRIFAPKEVKAKGGWGKCYYNEFHSS
jgi:hypothetical protein